MSRTFERRVFPVTDVKIVRATNDGTLKFRGRPWVYGQVSDDLGGWNEIIEAGAATRTLARTPDVRFLINHDANLLCARTQSGTLTLSEDAEGGIAEADLANVSYARDLAVLIERGDLTQMSFGFWITSDDWAGNMHVVREFDLDGGDVSAVTFPAFPQTSAELRTRAAAHLEAGLTESDLQNAETAGTVRRALEGLADQGAVERALIELREGKVLSSSNRQLVLNARDALSELLDKTETADRSGEQPPAGLSHQRAADRVRVLEAIASI